MSSTRPTKVTTDRQRGSAESSRILAAYLQPTSIAVTAPRMISTTTSADIRWFISSTRHQS